jgi:hypothetical protein
MTHLVRQLAASEEMRETLEANVRLMKLINSIEYKE